MAATLREVQMDSRKTSDGLLIQFQEFTWTPDGVHQEAWLSVRPSLIITTMNQTTSIRVVQVQGKVEFYPNIYK